MRSERREALIEAHRDLRKVAFDEVYPHVNAYFRAAEQALHGVKVASEMVSFDPTLLKHFAEE